MLKFVKTIMEKEGSDLYFKVDRQMDNGTRIGKWVADNRSAYKGW